MCGITTGGKEDCFWKCEIGNTVNGPIVKNPECLLACFEKVIMESPVLGREALKYSFGLTSSSTID